MTIRLLDDAGLVAELAEGWCDRDFIALDTEFIRTNTFYPRVGLLQLADQSACYLLDPLCIDDWQPLRTLLCESRCTPVLHSSGEDLNLLHTTIDCPPTRLFDTQVAAAFLGLGFSLGYQALVRQLLGVEIAKGETRSDWLRRPLSETQLHYAAMDVRYLLPLQELLQRRLHDKGLLEWFEEECRLLLEMAAAFDVAANWESVYTELGTAWRLDDDQLGCLQRLCCWRERKARQRDKPRNWIASDADLLTLASRFANGGSSSMAALESLDFPNRRWLQRHARELHEVLTAAADDYPRIDRTRLNAPLAPSLRKILRTWQALVNEKAVELTMVPELLARRKLLQGLLRGYQYSGELNWTGEMAGWRREVLESDFRRTLAGDCV